MYKPIAIMVSLALSGVVTSVQAEEAKTNITSNTVMRLGEINVTASTDPLATSEVLTSVDIVPAERLEDQVVTNTWELFDQVPGVMLTRFGQGTTSGKFSMRGFNGEGEINAVKLLIDGIPGNSNDGNMPYIDLASQLDIESIEVVKGTNDPRYGLHSIAGNANISTKIGGNYNKIRLTAGSFGTHATHAAMGSEAGNFSQNYSISYKNTDGYRDHAEADDVSFSGKWFVSSSDGSSRVGLIARQYKADAEEPGYLTQAQVDADPTQTLSHNLFDEDKRNVTQLAVQAESDFSNKLYGKAQVYKNDFYNDRFVRFSAGASQQERLSKETHIGASGSLTWQLGETSIGNVAIITGLDTERQDNTSERYTTNEQVRATQTRNQQYDFNTAGGFIQAVIKPSNKLTVTPAIRIDKISGNYTNLLTSTNYSINDYGLIEQPKLSAIYSFSDNMSVYGNWGRTFQVGVGTASYKVNQSNDLDPSINEGWELGLKFRTNKWLDGRVAIWKQTASNEARRKLGDADNDSENIGKTLREGIDLGINARASDDVSIWFSAALQNSKILQADASSPETTGKEIDHVPHLIYNLGVDYKMSEVWRFATWINSQSDYYLERTNSKGKYGDYTFLHASAKYKYSANISFELQARNLTNAYSEYVWYDSWTAKQSLHSPGQPRSLYVSANVSF